MKISLVNMPFAALDAPSLALTQLTSVLDSEFGGAVTTAVSYLNHDVGLFLGPTLYREIAFRSEHLYSGLGDWLFRQIAFPESIDNETDYFKRFYPRTDPQAREFRELIREKRSQLDALLVTMGEKYGIFGADVVGFTSMFAQSVASIALARKVKEATPRTIVVMGGANCEGTMGRAIAANVDVVDYVCSGPGLRSFPQLIDRLRAGARVGTSIAGVFPSARLSTEASVASTPSEDLGEELPIGHPVPLDYNAFLDSMETHFPHAELKPFLLFETSRGCWWGQKAHCTFCGLNGSTMRYRSMSPEDALLQFRALFAYAPRCRELASVDNILPKNYLREVLPYLETPESLNIFYEVKADLTAEDVEILARARVRSVQPGIESLSTSTLKLMRKGTSVFTNLRMLLHCRQFDVAPMWNLLVGFPGEEEDVFGKYLRDIPRLFHLTPPTGAFPVRFDRFSPYFERPNDWGLQLAPLDMYGYVYPFDDNAIAHLAYYFADKNYTAPYQLAMLRNLRAVQESVAMWRDRFSGFDGREPAELYMMPGSDGACVYDSRTGAVIEHVLDKPSRLVLQHLEIASNLRDLRAKFSDSIDLALAMLRERELIFEEGDRLMSIVLGKPAHRGHEYASAMVATANPSRAMPVREHTEAFVT